MVEANSEYKVFSLPITLISPAFGNWKRMGYNIMPLLQGAEYVREIFAAFERRDLFGFLHNCYGGLGVIPLWFATFQFQGSRGYGLVR